MIRRPIPEGWNPTWESAFIADYDQHCGAIQRVMVFIGAFAFSLFGMVEAIFYGKTAAGIYINFGFVVVGLLIQLAGTFHPSYARINQLFCASAAIVVLGGQDVLYMVFAPDHLLLYGRPGGVFITMLFYCALKLRFATATLASLAYVSVILVTLLVRDLYSTEGFVSNCVFLIASNLIGMFVAWQLELGVRRDFQQKLTIQAEQEKAESLLRNILPDAIVSRLKHDGKTIADHYEDVTVMFADLVGFTPLAARISPQDLVGLLNDVFSRFDTLAEQHGLEKIKTIGDAYMVVAGLPLPRADHALVIAAMALDMQQAILDINRERTLELSLRIGVNSGPVIAGVIGRKKFIYDLWGDTVNLASRMESHGTPGRIQVTAATADRLQGHFTLESRGSVAVKGRGEVIAFWLVGEAQAATA